MPKKQVAKYHFSCTFYFKSTMSSDKVQSTMHASHTLHKYFTLTLSKLQINILINIIHYIEMPKKQVAKYHLILVERFISKVQ